MCGNLATARCDATCLASAHAAILLPVTSWACQRGNCPRLLHALLRLAGNAIASFRGLLHCSLLSISGSFQSSTASAVSCLTLHFAVLMGKNGQVRNRPSALLALPRHQSMCTHP